MHWLKKLRAQVRFKEPLENHTTLHVGGLADAWVEPEDWQELGKIIAQCRKAKIAYLVIGRGSNILVSDQGLRGLAICLNSPAFTKLEIRGKRISLGAGLPINRLINEAQQQGLGGLEFLAGIPASLGGALVMNAGGKKYSIGNFVKTVTAMDRSGKIKRLKKGQLRFSYRNSNLKQYIVLEAVLNLAERNPAEIKKMITANLTEKRKTQDLTAKSAGCIFKNPPYPLTAGQMIDACGLKGQRYGGAQISQKHANYIINRNGAKAKDIFYLIDLAQRQVKKKFGVPLEPEIEIIK